MAQYLKPDSELGYVEDTAEIEFLKFNNLRHSILGCMLGDFDELGSYVVSPEIVKELISMEKYVVQTYDNIELCRSTLKLDKQISFMVTLEGNKATLSLVEKLNYEANFMLNSGTYSNINEYVLDSVETSGEVNRNMLYTRWNIKTTPGNVIDIFNCDDEILEKYFGIVNRFKFLLKANTKMLQKEAELENVEAGYAIAIFEILKRYPNFQQVVVENIKEALAEKKDALSIKKPFFAKTFNELLENAIQKNISVLSEKEKLDFLLEKRNEVVNLNIRRQDIFEVEQVEQISITEDELLPKVYQIKLTEEDKKQTLIEVAQELVGEHKKVASRVSSAENEQYESDLFRRTILAVGEKKGNVVELPEEIIQMIETDRDKLIALLSSLGIIELLSVEDETEANIEAQKDKTLGANSGKGTKNEKSSTKVGTIKFANINYAPKTEKAAKNTTPKTEKAETSNDKEINEEKKTERILSATPAQTGPTAPKQTPSAGKNVDNSVLNIVANAQNLVLTTAGVVRGGGTGLHTRDAANGETGSLTIHETTTVYESVEVGNEHGIN